MFSDRRALYQDSNSAGSVVGPDVLRVVAGDVALGPPLRGPLVPVVGDHSATVVRGRRHPRRSRAGAAAGGGSGRARVTAAAARPVVGPDVLRVVARDVALGPPLRGPGVPVVGDHSATVVGSRGNPRRSRAGAGAAGRGGRGRGARARRTAAGGGRAGARALRRRRGRALRGRAVDVGDRVVEQRRGRVEVVEREHHRAAETVAVQIVGLGLDRLGVLAGPEVGAVVEVGSLRRRIPEGVRRVVHHAAQFLVHPDARHVAGERGAGGRTAGRLEQAVVRAGRHPGPAAVVERHADGQLAGREAAGYPVLRITDRPGLDRLVDRVLRGPGGDRAHRVVRVVVDRRLVVGRACALPAAVHVVGHHVGEGQVLPDVVGLDVRDLVLAGRYRGGQRVLLAGAA